MNSLVTEVAKAATYLPQFRVHLRVTPTRLKDSWFFRTRSFMTTEWEFWDILLNNEHT